MKLIILSTLYFLLSTFVVFSASAEEITKEPWQSTRMKQILKPWLEPDKAPEEGPDAIKEYIEDYTAKILKALPESLSVKPEKKRKILLLTTGTRGALHSPGAAGLIILLRAAAEKYGTFELTERFSEHGLDAESLGTYDAVVLNNTAVVMGNKEEKETLLDVYRKEIPEYVKAGGGVLAVHSTIQMFMDQPDSAYNRMFGVYNRHARGKKGSVHPKGAMSVFTVTLPDPENTLASAFRRKGPELDIVNLWLDKGTRREIKLQLNTPGLLADELYILAPSDKPEEMPHVILSIDPEKSRVKFPDDAGPVCNALVWYKPFGKGRVFYSQFGHNISVFGIPCIAENILDGLQYVSGDLRISSGFRIVDPKPFRAIVPEGANLEKLAGGMHHAEGPVWIPGDPGRLVVSDHYHGKLKEWLPGSGIRLIGWSGNNGNAVDAQGRLVSCVPKHKHVVRREQDGTITVLADTYQGKKFNSPNDLAIHSDGSVWFTDPCWSRGRNNQPKNRVYRIDPETKEVAAVTESCILPNGICFSPDEKLMYIADTARGIWVFRVEGRGVKGKGRILKWRSRLATPDGIKCDKAGNIYMNGNEGTGIYSPEDGRLLGIINTPEPSINHCFGGEDGNTLFISTKKGLYRIDLKVESRK